MQTNYKNIALITVIICLYFLNGCSSLIIEEVMLPVEGDGLEISKNDEQRHQPCAGYFTNKEVGLDVKFQCGEFHYELGAIKLNVFAMLGPPLLPLLPLQIKDTNTFALIFKRIDSDGVETIWPSCPVPTIHHPADVSVVETDVGGPYRQNCRYKFDSNEDITDDFVLSFESKENACITKKVYFKPFKKIDYCMFTSPVY